jgi:hypothetical protein
MPIATLAAYGASVAGQTRSLDLALAVVAPLAAVFGVAAGRLADSVDRFAVALTAKVAFGLLGGLASTAVRRRVSVRLPSDRRGEGPGGAGF